MSSRGGKGWTSRVSAPGKSASGIRTEQVWLPHSSASSWQPYSETKVPMAERPWKILGDPPQTLPRAAVDRQDVGMNGQSLPQKEYTYRTLSLGYSLSPEAPWCFQKWHPGASLPFWLVLPCTLPRMTTRSHVTNKSSVDPWYQRGTEKQARPFPEPRLGQSSPLSRGYIPSRLSLFCTSTNGQEQGIPPRSLEPQLCTPLQQVEHKGKPAKTSTLTGKWMNS